MDFKVIYLLFYFIIILNTGNLGAGIGSLFKSKYKMKLHSIEICKLPDDKWDLDHRIEMKFRAKKINRRVTVIEANYTVKPGAPRLSFNLRGYELQNNLAKNLVFKIENISCTNTLVYETMKVAGFQLTPDCIPVVGSFTMPSVNLDDFAFMMTTTALSGPGRYGYEFETFGKYGFMSCVAMACDLVLNNK